MILAIYEYLHLRFMCAACPGLFGVQLGGIGRRYPVFLALAGSSLCLWLFLNSFYDRISFTILKL